MPPRLFGAALILLGLATNVEASAQGCLTDADCKSPRVCFEGSCKRLSPSESLLRVELAQPIETTASLFIDESYMGDLPWAGIVTAGWHTIRVEAYGRLPSSFRGESRGGRADTLQITLEPDPAFAPPAAQTSYGGQTQPAPANQPEESSGQPGMLSLALIGGVGYGTAAWGPDQAMRPATTLLGGGAFGVRVLDDPFWLELGLAITSRSIFIQEWVEDWGKFLILDFGLLVRMMFEVSENFAYIGAELEPGYGLSNRRYGYGALRFAVSILPTEWLELRVNLGGIYDQELMGKGWLAGAQLTCGVAFRFVD